jgi:hypothetical protein
MTPTARSHPRQTHPGDSGRPYVDHHAQSLPRADAAITINPPVNADGRSTGEVLEASYHQSSADRTKGGNPSVE